MKRLIIAASLIATALFAWSAPVNADSQTFKMMAENGSGETGTVTFTPILGGTRVYVKVDNEPDGAIQPDHIHVGGCPGVGAVKYPLKDVVFGHSTTFIPGVTPDMIVGASGGYAVNVHAARDNMKTYVSCANIK
jgi:Cu/Zn superoxide dismutase